MKIAVASEKTAVTEHFGHCVNFNVYEVEDGNIIKSESIPNPGHKPGFLPKFIADLGVSVIISGGMGARAIEIFNDNGIEVVVGVKGEAERVVKLFLQGKLKSTGEVCNHHMHSDSCGG